MEINSCVHCGLCTKNCVFLEKYGLDLAGFAQRPDLAFSCFLCGKCKAVCPKDIDGIKIALDMRHNQVEEAGGKTDPAYNGLMWEKNGYKFANYRKADKKSVLFPGCNFPSFYPETTRVLEGIMKKHGIGVVYECCSKPVNEVGLKNDASSNLQKMEARLRAQGVEELIVLCPNCYHFMKDKITLPMVTVYDKLKELGEGKDIELPALPVYYPCPDRAEKVLFGGIRKFIKGEITEPFGKLQCCGLGGCAAAREPELSRQMAENAAKQGSDVLYTYCASCISNFRRKGFMETYHLLPMILGVNEKVPLGMQPIFNRAKKKLF